MQAAVHLAQQVDAAALVVTTVSGGAARAAAKYRPRLPVIALSEDQRVRRQLALEWGVVPGRLPPRPASAEELAALMLERARAVGGLESGTTSWSSPTGRRARAAARRTPSRSVGSLAGASAGAGANCRCVVGQLVSWENG